MDGTKVARCSATGCRKRLNLTSQFSCRCNYTFCMLHRLPEEHDCNFDYKSEGKNQLQKSNQLVVADKFIRI